MDESLPAPGSVRHLVWLYAAPEDRSRLAALFALEREIAASIDPSLDHTVAHARLGWWQEECERLAAALPRHPQAIALLQASRRAGIAAPDLTPLVAAAAWDLASATPAQRSDLEQRCAQWARGCFRHVAPIAPTAMTSQAAGGNAAVDRMTHVGRRIEELALLGAVRTDARRGRLRAPVDELTHLGVAPEALAEEPFAPALAAYLAARHRTLREELAMQLATLEPDVRPALRPVFVWATLAAAGSRRAVSALPSSAVPGRFDAVRDTWTAWRAARHALSRRLPALGTNGPAPDIRRHPS